MLRDFEIRAAKSGPTLQKLSDGAGLQLWLMPGGKKVWRLAYRFLGKQRSLVLGSYPDLSLSDARKKRAEARQLIEGGTDPARAKQEAKAQSIENSANTFEALAAELLIKKQIEGKASATIGKREWLYSLANERIGRSPIRDVAAPVKCGNPSGTRSAAC
ncbi:Integrase, DNA-binding domain containing protein [Rhabdaerophilaceae bacterium]